LSGSHKVAIVAALEREVKPLVRDWRVTRQQHDGRTFKFFENDRAVLVCGGMGAESARRATEAVIALYQPALVTSVGFAGALDRELKVGGLFSPRRVIDARDGSSVDTGIGAGVLVSSPAIADPAQKARLAASFGAQAVDMEAAAVARGAQARGVRFTALKAISDESSFPMPAMEGFIGPDGQFLTGKFARFAAVRPWLWVTVITLARNSSKASNSLCCWLDQFNHAPEMVAGRTPGWHPATRGKHS
jgi:adenosylhomocysteine nucleosidase